MQSVLFINHNFEVLYHRVEALQIVIKDDRKRGKFKLFLGMRRSCGWTSGTGLDPLACPHSGPSGFSGSSRLPSKYSRQWPTGNMNYIKEWRTNNNRWGENGGGIPQACYLHHVYSRYLAQTVCETDKLWQMRRKWRWDSPGLLSSPRVQYIGILHKQSVRRTNYDRWGENGGGITKACYLHHV